MFEYASFAGLGLRLSTGKPFSTWRALEGAKGQDLSSIVLSLGNALLALGFEKVIFVDTTWLNSATSMHQYIAQGGPVGFAIPVVNQLHPSVPEL